MALMSVPQRLPQHTGDHILPSFPVFNRLLFLAGKCKSLAIRDTSYGHEATYEQLLSDVLHLRNAIRRTLNPTVQTQLLRGERVCINVLAPGSYEFAVAFLALAALGAVIVPISVAAAPEEAAYYASTCHSIGIIYASKYAEFGEQLARQMRASRDPQFVSLEVLPHFLHKPLIPADKIIISSDHILDYNGPGLAIYTSGTSGPPKCAVRRRGFFDMMSHGIAQWYDLSEDDVVLHTLPVHHATGIGISFMPFLISGATIDFQSSGFKEDQIWERWRQGGLTIFSGVPTMYMRLMRYYEEVLSKRPDAGTYRDAAGALRIMMSGSAALPFTLQAKWARLRGGRKILERYGTTEFGSAFSVRPGDGNNPDGSVGKVFPGVAVKLANGDEGEILLKTPHMFSEYMFDPKATAAAFTADGWYKTGDVARREGEYYFILGRASIDIIKSGGYKISALDIEREMLGLAYVSEVMVVGVEDEEFGQRVAAAVVLRKGTPSLSLDKLRADLRSRLAGYKMPTLLRVVDVLPKSGSGKVVKRILRQDLFPAQGHPDIQAWRLQRSKL